MAGCIEAVDSLFNGCEALGRFGLAAPAPAPAAAAAAAGAGTGPTAVTTVGTMLLGT